MPGAVADRRGNDRLQAFARRRAVVLGHPEPQIARDRREERAGVRGVGQGFEPAFVFVRRADREHETFDRPSAEGHADAHARFHVDARRDGIRKRVADRRRDRDVGDAIGQRLGRILRPE